MRSLLQEREIYIFESLLSMVMMLLSTDLGRYKDKRDVISTYVGMSYVTSHVDYVPKYMS